MRAVVVSVAVAPAEAVDAPERIAALDAVWRDAEAHGARVARAGIHAARIAFDAPEPALGWARWAFLRVASLGWGALRGGAAAGEVALAADPLTGGVALSGPAADVSAALAGEAAPGELRLADGLPGAPAVPAGRGGPAGWALGIVGQEPPLQAVLAALRDGRGRHRASAPARPRWRLRAAWRWHARGRARLRCGCRWRPSRGRAELVGAVAAAIGAPTSPGRAAPTRPCSACAPRSPPATGRCWWSSTTPSTCRTGGRADRRIGSPPLAPSPRGCRWAAPGGARRARRRRGRVAAGPPDAAPERRRPRRRPRPWRTGSTGCRSR
ncbi:MAG: hypothetical protein R3F59_30170 [Myxococcota bacterium]